MSNGRRGEREGRTLTRSSLFRKPDLCNWVRFHCQLSTGSKDGERELEEEQEKEEKKEGKEEKERRRRMKRVRRRKREKGGR